VGTEIFFGKSEIRLDTPVDKQPDGQIKGASRSGNYGWAIAKPIIITVACMSAATLLTRKCQGERTHEFVLGRVLINPKRVMLLAMSASRTRTSLDAFGMSQRCHFRTHAAQQNGRLFKHLMNERTALARLNDAAAIKPFNTPQRKCEDDDNAVCLAQRLDKNSKTAPVNAAGSRLGPSWPTF
jgi:hypothetical protein